MVELYPDRHVGYVRVSTDEQNHDMQIDALLSRNIPRELIFSDVESGRTPTLKRPGLIDALKACRAGGTLWVWRLDRLGRNVVELLLTVHRLHERQVKFASVTQSELNSDAMQRASGTFMFHIHAALAQYESDQLSERTKAGMAAAKARGAKFGRKGFDELFVESGIVADYQRLVQSGMKPTAAREKLKIPASTYRKYKPTFDPVRPMVDDPGLSDVPEKLLVDDIG